MSEIKKGLGRVGAGFIIFFVLAFAVDLIQFIITSFSIALVVNPASIVIGGVVGVLAATSDAIFSTSFVENIFEAGIVFLLSTSALSIFILTLFLLHLATNSRQNSFLIGLIFILAFSFEIIPILNGFLWFWTLAVVLASRISNIVNLGKKQ